MGPDPVSIAALARSRRFCAPGASWQANPDAGDAKTSDSDGKGVWVGKGNSVRGKWVEITADRQTHKLSGFGELRYALTVKGDRLTGTASFRQYDESHVLVDGPFASTLSGTRVTLP